MVVGCCWVVSQYKGYRRYRRYEQSAVETLFWFEPASIGGNLKFASWQLEIKTDFSLGASTRKVSQTSVLHMFGNELLISKKKCRSALAIPGRYSKQVQSSRSSLKLDAEHVSVLSILYTPSIPCQGEEPADSTSPAPTNP